MALAHYVDDYNGVFFGKLSLFELQGMRFVAYSTSAAALNLNPIDIEELPDFITHLVMSVNKKSNALFGNHDLYVVNKADLKPLGDCLSLDYSIVSIEGRARVLSFWEKGTAVKHRTLDEFYTNITPEERTNYSY